MLTRTSRPPAEAAQVSFVAALAVADLAQAYVPAAIVRLKWPNDVLLDGGKVSGILIESGALEGGDLWLAVGVGVNLASHPGNTDRAATHLGAHLRPEFAAPPALEAALDQLSSSFERWLGVWEQGGFAPIREAWTQAAGGLGGPATARLGTETLTGVAEGLEGDGALRLRLSDGSVRRITAGDVFFGPAA